VSCGHANGFQAAKPNKERRTIGSLMICVSVAVLLFGMPTGIAIGIQQYLAIAPAHAHLGLIGDVPLFRFGQYDRLRGEGSRHLGGRRHLLSSSVA
jgi:hypothetical protein